MLDVVTCGCTMPKALTFADVTLTRKDKDAWTVDPGDLPADINEVRSYLSTLRSTRAVDFADDTGTDLAKYGLQTPRLSVTLFLPDGKTQTCM